MNTTLQMRLKKQYLVMHQMQSDLSKLSGSINCVKQDKRFSPLTKERKLLELRRQVLGLLNDERTACEILLDIMNESEDDYSYQKESNLTKLTSIDKQIVNVAQMIKEVL